MDHTHFPNREYDAGSSFKDTIPAWREPTILDGPGTREMPAHTCGYCGSISPLDLLQFFREGKVHESSPADRKYGYLHKVYLDIENPSYGRETTKSTTSMGYRPKEYATDQEFLDAGHMIVERWDVRHTITRTKDGEEADSREDTHYFDYKIVEQTSGSPTVYCKFYTVHLRDLAKYDFEMLRALYQYLSGSELEDTPENREKWGVA